MTDKSKDFEIPITGEVADEILRRLKENEQPDEIAKALHIKPLYVYYIEHRWALEELLSDTQKPSETIMELKDKSPGKHNEEDTEDDVDDPLDEGKHRHTRVAVLLRNGLSAPLAAVETKLAIWVVSRVAKQVNKHRANETEPAGVMPKRALFECLVLSIFVNHFRNISQSIDDGLSDLSESERQRENMRQVIEACAKTSEEIQQSNIVSVFDMLYPSKNKRDTKLLAEAFLSIGELYPKAAALRRQWALPKALSERYARREKFRSYDFIIEEKCPDCASMYAYVSKQKVQHRRCPYCELSEQLRIAFDVSVDDVSGNSDDTESAS